METMKTAIIGSPDVIRVFGAFGIDRFPITEAAKAPALLKQLANDSYAVVLVTESLAKEAPELLEMYKSKPLPSVVCIPVGAAGKSADVASLGMDILRTSARKAAGIDILGKR